MVLVREKPFAWLKKHLDSERVLLLLGPRQVGKTTLLKQFYEHCKEHGRTSFFFTLEDISLRALLDGDPKNLFQIIAADSARKLGKTVVCIDEIQYLKEPSNFLKYIYDMHGESIKLVVTGSSAFYIDQKFSDSLAGRKHIYEMMSLDFPEFLIFRHYGGTVPPRAIIDETALMPLYYEYLTYGGYPAVVLAPTHEDKRELLRELANSYTKKDVLDYEVSSQEEYLKILKVLALQIGGLLNVDSIANTLNVPHSTVARYLFVMQRSYHVATIAPWFVNKKKEIKKMPKAFFLDLGLRNFLVNNFDPYESRIDKGAVLENAVFLALLSRYDKDDIHFWRTHAKQEVDFVIPRTAAYEVKQSLSAARGAAYEEFKRAHLDTPLSFVTLESSMALFWK